MILINPPKLLKQSYNVLKIANKLFSAININNTNSYLQLVTISQGALHFAK